MLNNKLYAVAYLASVGFLPLAQAAEQIQDTRWYILRLLLALLIPAAIGKLRMVGAVVWALARSLINISTSS